MRHFLKGACHKYLRVEYYVGANLLAKQLIFKGGGKAAEKGKHIAFKSPQYDGYLLLI